MREGVIIHRFVPRSVAFRRKQNFKNLFQAPSPSSALMTVSLDAYLDPQRMSFESPNEMLGRVCSPDDTFPVFSPPPCEVVFLSL